MLQVICFIFAKLEESVYFFNPSLENYSKTSPSTTKKFKKFTRNILNTDRWLRLWNGWIMDLKWQWFWTFSIVPLLSCTDLILWLQQTRHRYHILQWSIALVYAKSSDHDEKGRNILYSSSACAITGKTLNALKGWPKLQEKQIASTWTGTDQLAWTPTSDWQFCFWLHSFLEPIVDWN
jgi:hypothetical protein